MATKSDMPNSGDMSDMTLEEMGMWECDNPTPGQNKDFYKICDEVGMKGMDSKKKKMLQSMPKEKS